MDGPKEPKYGTALEGQLKIKYIDGELGVAQQSVAGDLDSFEAMLDIIECKRTEGEYDWHSDIFFPVYPAMYHTQASIDGAQLAMTRDYSDVYLEDGSPDAKKKAAAAKECINRTLNQRHLYFFQKYMRAQGIRRLSQNGVVLRCWWEREDEDVVTGFRNYPVEDTVDVYGNPITDPTVQVPAMKQMSEPITGREPKIDRFNCDVVDPRNVWMSPEYCYSIQDKRYVYIRFERALQELQEEAKQYGYINLDLLESVEPPRETDTSKESFNKIDAKDLPTKGNEFDVIERYGKGCVKVTKRDPVTEEPLECEPGYDEFGKPLKDAEWHEIVVGWAKSADKYTMIRHQLTAYVDTQGNPYRPLVRGVCYIHPTKDGGIGDGPIANQLQVAINDTLNMSNDRVRLATFPVIKVGAYDAEESETVYEFKPGHRMVLTDVKNAEEFRVRDDVSGAMGQVGVFTNGLQQGIGIYPPTMGDTPELASTTATAIASAGAHANTRSAYQSLTAEHTILTELYWMILQMTGKFAHPKTGEKLMGDKVYDFDPNADYFYKPVTQAIEPESSKFQKRKDIATIFGYVAQVPNPGTPKLLNLLLKKYFESYGDEYEEFAGSLLDPNAPMQPPTQGGIAGGVEPTPTSNQNLMPMSPMEMQTRGRMGGF